MPLEKKIFLTTWRLALLMGIVYGCFYMIVLKLLNPAGNKAGIIDWLVTFGQVLISVGCIYFLYKLSGKVVINIRPGFVYMLLLLLSVPLFAGLYLAYWLTMRKLLYGLSTPYSWYMPQLLTTTLSGHLPIGVISFLSLYSSHLHKVQVELITAQNLATENHLKGLYQQVEPHFLFNNLNILTSLIKLDTEKAIQFTQKLSDVYRFYLDAKQENFILLEEELNFINEYFYLISCRFGKAFTLHTNIPDTYLTKEYYIVPGTLQLLVENVIKHNSADTENPIAIVISSEKDGISVQNKVLKKTVPTSGHGLHNLAMRYKLLRQSKVVAHEKDGSFHVWLPLIKKIPAL